MSTGLEKLQWDLEILEAMAADMAAYLDGETLYWQLSQGDMPKLTLGGYLMRQQRLQALRPYLSDGEQTRLTTAVTEFNEALQEKIVRSEHRAHEELGVRARQWGTYMNDVQSHVPTAAVNYGTAVENRLMIAALIQFLQTPPYQLEAGHAQNVKMLDGTLRSHWHTGAFVWADEWAAAYPADEYWWLYGRPKGR